MEDQARFPAQDGAVGDQCAAHDTGSEGQCDFSQIQATPPGDTDRKQSPEQPELRKEQDYTTRRPLHRDVGDGQTEAVRDLHHPVGVVTEKERQARGACRLFEASRCRFHRS